MRSSLNKPPHKSACRQHTHAREGPVIKREEVAALLTQIFVQKRIEAQGRDHQEKQKGDCKNQRHLVEELVALGMGYVTEADERQVAQVLQNQLLHQDGLEKVKASQLGAYFIPAQHDEQGVEQKTDDDVLRDRVEEEGEVGSDEH